MKPMIVKIGSFKEDTETGITITEWVFNTVESTEYFTLEEIKNIAVNNGTYCRSGG